MEEQINSIIALSKDINNIIKNYDHIQKINEEILNRFFELFNIQNDKINEYFQKIIKVLQTFQKYLENLKILNNVYIYVPNKYIVICNNIVKAINISLQEVYSFLKNEQVTDKNKIFNEELDRQYENIVILFPNIISHLKENQEVNKLINIMKINTSEQKNKNIDGIIVLSEYFINNSFENEKNLFSIFIESEFLYVITKRNSGKVYNLNNGKCVKSIQNGKDVLIENSTSSINLISMLDVKSMNLVKETISSGTTEQAIWNIIYSLKGFKNIIRINKYVYDELINNKFMRTIIQKNGVLTDDDENRNINEISNTIDEVPNTKNNVNNLSQNQSIVSNTNVNTSQNNLIDINSDNDKAQIEALKLLMKQRVDFENKLKYEWQIIWDDVKKCNIASAQEDIEKYDQQIKDQTNNYIDNIKNRNNLLNNLQNIILKSNEEYESFDNKINKIKENITELNLKQQELEVKISKLNKINENITNQENIDTNNPDTISSEKRIINLKKLDQLQNLFLNNNREIFKLNKTRIAYLETQDSIERDLFAKTLELRQSQTKIEKEMARYRTEIYSTIFLHVKLELAIYYKINELLDTFNSNNDDSSEFNTYLSILKYSIKTRRIIESKFIELFRQEIQLSSFSNIDKHKDNIIIQIENLQKNYEDTQKEYSTFSLELIPQKENYNYQKGVIEDKLKELLQKINDLEEEYHPTGNSKSLSEEDEYLLSLKFQPLEQDVLAYMEKQKLYECEIKRLDRVEEKYNYRAMTLKEELISTKLKFEVIKKYEQIIQSEIINYRNDIDDKISNLIEHLKPSYDINFNVNDFSIDKLNFSQPEFDLQLSEHSQDIIDSNEDNHILDINKNNLSFLSYTSENINHELSIDLNNFNQSLDTSIPNFNNKDFNEDLITKTINNVNSNVDNNNNNNSIYQSTPQKINSIEQNVVNPTDNNNASKEEIESNDISFQENADIIEQKYINKQNKLNEIITTINNRKKELNNSYQEKEEKANSIIIAINNLKNETISMNNNFESLCKVLSNKQDLIGEKIKVSKLLDIKLLNDIKQEYANLCTSLSNNKEKFIKIGNQLEPMVSQSNSFNVPLETQLRKLEATKTQIESLFNQIIDKKNNKTELYEKLYVLEIKLLEINQQKLQLKKALININKQYEIENNQIDSHLTAIAMRLNELKMMEPSEETIQEENNLKSLIEKIKEQQDELDSDMETIKKQSTEESNMLNENTEELKNEYFTLEKSKIKYSKKDLLNKISELTDIYEKNLISVANQVFVLDSEQQEHTKINSELKEINNKLNDFILHFEKINQSINNNKIEFEPMVKYENNENDNNLSDENDNTVKENLNGSKLSIKNEKSIINEDVLQNNGKLNESKLINEVPVNLSINESLYKNFDLNDKENLSLSFYQNQQEQFEREISIICNKLTSVKKTRESLGNIETIPEELDTQIISLCEGLSSIIDNKHSLFTKLTSSLQDNEKQKAILNEKIIHLEKELASMLAQTSSQEFEIESQKTEYEKKIKYLNDKSNDMQKKIGGLAKDKIALNSKLNKQQLEWQNTETQYKNEIEKLNKNVNDLEQERDYINQTMEESQANWDKLKKEYEEKINKLNIQFKEYEKKVNKIKEDNETINNEKIELQDQINTIQSQINFITNERDSYALKLKNETTTYNNKTAKINKQLEELKQELEVSNKSYDDLKLKYNQVISEIKEKDLLYEKEIENYEKEIEHIDESKRMIEKELSNSKEKIISLENTIREISSYNTKLDNIKMNTKNAGTEVEDMIKNTNFKFNEFSSLISEIQDKIYSYTNKRKPRHSRFYSNNSFTMSKQLEDIKNNVTDLINIITNQEKQLKFSRTENNPQIEELMKRIDTLSSEKNSLEATLKSAKSISDKQMEQLKTTLSCLGIELTTIKQHRDSLKLDLTNCMNIIEQYKDKMTKDTDFIENKYVNVLNERNSFEEKFVELKQDYDEKIKSLEELQQKLAESNEQLNNQETKIKELNDQYEMIKTEKEKLEEIENTNKTLIEENKNLKEELTGVNAGKDVLVNELTEQFKKSEDEKNDLSNKANKMSSENKELKLKLMKVEKEYQNKINELNQQLNEVSHQIELASQEKTHFEHEITNLEEKLQNTISEKDQLSLQLNEKALQLKQIQKQLNRQIDTLNNEKKSLELQIAQSKNYVDDSIKEQEEKIKEMNESHSQLNQKYKELISQLEKISKEKFEFKSKILNLESQLEENKINMVNKNDLIEKDEECKKLKNEINSIKENKTKIETMLQNENKKLKDSLNDFKNNSTQDKKLYKEAMQKIDELKNKKIKEYQSISNLLNVFNNDMKTLSKDINLDEELNDPTTKAIDNFDDVKEYLNIIQNNFTTISNKYKSSLKDLNHYQKLSESLSEKLEEMDKQLSEIKKKQWYSLNDNNENNKNIIKNVNQIGDVILKDMINNSVKDVVISSLNEKINLLNQENQYKDDINKYTYENMANIKTKQNELNQKLEIINNDLDELKMYKNKIINTEESYINNHYVKDILMKIKDVFNIFLIELPSSVCNGFEIQNYYDFFDSFETSNEKSEYPKYSINEFIENIKNIIKEIKYFVENRINEIENYSKYQEALKKNDELVEKNELLKKKLNDLENKQVDTTRNTQKFIDVNSKVNLLKSNFNSFLSILSNMNSDINDQQNNRNDKKINDIINKSKNISLNINELVNSINNLMTSENNDINIDNEISSEIMYKNNIQLLTDEISSLIEQRDSLNDQILTLKEEQMSCVDRLNKSNAEVSFLRNNSNSAWSRLETQVKKYDKLKNSYENYKKNSDNKLNELMTKNNELVQQIQFYQENMNLLKKENQDLTEKLKKTHSHDDSKQIMLMKSNSSVKSSTSTEENTDEDVTYKYSILKKKYDFMREQYNRIKIVNEETKNKVDEYTKKYNYVQNQYNKVRSIKFERDNLLNCINLLKEFAVEYKMQINNQRVMNNEAFVKSFIEFLRKKLSTHIVKERLYEELKEEINDLIDAKDYLFQNQEVEGKAFDRTDEDFEKHLKEVLDKLSEARDKLNNELTNIQTSIPEPKSRLELKIEKLKNNLKHQSNENRFLQQKLKNTEKSNEEMTSKIANEFSLILKQYDKLNEEISNVHSTTKSDDLLNLSTNSKSNILNDLSFNNSKLNSNHSPNSMSSSNLNNMANSESLLMDMTFWSTSSDDYSIEQNSIIQEHNYDKNKNSVTGNNHNNHNKNNRDDKNNMLNKNCNSNNNNSITSSQESDIKSNKSEKTNSKSNSNNSSDNILVLKNMFSKIIKSKNIS